MGENIGINLERSGDNYRCIIGTNSSSLDRLYVTQPWVNVGAYIEAQELIGAAGTQEGGCLGLEMQKIAFSILKQPENNLVYKPPAGIGIRRVNSKGYLISEFVLQDGHHRVLACNALGLGIEVRVIKIVDIGDIRSLRSLDEKLKSYGHISPGSSIERFRKFRRSNLCEL